MLPRYPLRTGLMATASLLLTAITGPIAANAGFSPEVLAGFEISEYHGIVKTVIPELKVLELGNPEGHSVVLTVGIDLEPLKLEPGDEVDVDVLDGLVVDMQRSETTDLTFEREDIILPEDMGRLKQGMRVALASGTAKIIKISRVDHSISLMGPLGGIHNLDVIDDPEGIALHDLNPGDFVEFRLIQPVAVSVKKSDFD